ncbi:hypothetical protein AVEN_203578-1 [Araneus ventricosus]|uniref:Uncharacterized protein n=1 Tax=Araneus ventricosus TaxID=182803 RepID=A0A4Y2ENU1_ARAVE|nr:hypothetical protein AVEN_203578-1 [Araneus ventricosus]
MAVASIHLTKTWIVHQAATRKSRNQEKEGDITSHPFFTSPSHLAEREKEKARVFHLLPYILFLTETCSNASPPRTLVCALSVQL